LLLVYKNPAKVFKALGYRKMTYSFVLLVMIYTTFFSLDRKEAKDQGKQHCSAALACHRHHMCDLRL